MSFVWYLSAPAGPERTLNPLVHVKSDLVRTAETTQRLLQHLARVWAQAILLMLMMASTWQRTNGSAASRLTRGRWCLASLVFSRLHNLVGPAVACPEAIDAEPPDNPAPGRKGRSSQYRGLSWHKSVRKWSVQLRIHGKASCSLSLTTYMPGVARSVGKDESASLLYA